MICMAISAIDLKSIELAGAAAEVVAGAEAVAATAEISEADAESDASWNAALFAASPPPMFEVRART